MGRNRADNRLVATTTLDPDVHEAVVDFIILHNMTKSAFLRMAVDHFLYKSADEWKLGYLDGTRTGQKDLGDQLSRLLHALKEAGDEVRAYRKVIRESVLTERAS
jgi:hypothetical protein